MTRLSAYCVRVKRDTKEKIIATIKESDGQAFIGPEGNPVTFWVLTKVFQQHIESCEDVVDVVESNSEIFKELVQQAYVPNLEYLNHAQLMHATDEPRAHKSALNAIKAIWKDFEDPQVREVLIDMVVNTHSEHTRSPNSLAPQISSPKAKC